MDIRSSELGGTNSVGVELTKRKTKKGERGTTFIS